MGHHALLARLERDAAAREAAALARADAEVAALRGQTEADASLELEQVLGEQRRARAALQQRELAAARASARAQVLRAQRAFLDRVRARSLELARAAEGDPALTAALPRWLTEALQYLEGVPATVRVRPSLGPALQPLVHGRVGLTLVLDAAVAPGVVAAADDGSLRVDNTLPERVERRLAALGARQLAQVPP